MVRRNLDHRRSGLPPATIDVAGQGVLALAPTLFQRFPGTSIDPGLPPVVFYPARGRARLWALAAPSAPEPLKNILGGPRARLLIRLELPATTAQLAAENCVTPAAISQHLSALHRAGLLDRSRAGRQVWYSHSRLGAELVCMGHANRPGIARESVPLPKTSS